MAEGSRGGSIKARKIKSALESLGYEVKGADGSDIRYGLAGTSLLATVGTYEWAPYYVTKLLVEHNIDVERFFRDGMGLGGKKLKLMVREYTKLVESRKGTDFTTQSEESKPAIPEEQPTLSAESNEKTDQDDIPKKPATKTIPGDHPISELNFSADVLDRCKTFGYTRVDELDKLLEISGSENIHAEINEFLQNFTLGAPRTKASVPRASVPIVSSVDPGYKKISNDKLEERKRLEAEREKRKELRGIERAQEKATEKVKNEKVSAIHKELRDMIESGDFAGVGMKLESLGVNVTDSKETISIQSKHIGSYLKELAEKGKKPNMDEKLLRHTQEHIPPADLLVHIAGAKYRGFGLASTLIIRALNSLDLKSILFGQEDSDTNPVKITPTGLGGDPRV